MANTFMIEVRFNGRPLYANVYLYARGQLTYHVKFFGEELPEFLKDTVVFRYEEDVLQPIEDGIPGIFLRRIVEAINKHLL